jgi:hypothetical protein
MRLIKSIKILGVAVGAIGTAVSVALTSWGTFLKSEDDEAKKDERDDVARKERGWQVLNPEEVLCWRPILALPQKKQIV